jgi:hypothetical protein
MKRRTYLRALIWIAPALVLGGYLCFRLVRDSLLRSAVERAVARATGGSCRVRGAVVRDGRIYFSGLKLEHPSGAVLSCAAAVVPERGWPIDDQAPGRVDLLDVQVSMAGLPPVRIDKLNVIRARDERTGKLRLTFLAVSECAGFNAALEKKAGVRFEQGKLEIYSLPELDGKTLNFPILLRLIDFKVRSTDGRFEVEAAEARAAVRITGTRKQPRIDLGELEPYLGKGFVTGFRDLLP